jgi:peptide/nickel transport system substrate-binding protein
MRTRTPLGVTAGLLAVSLLAAACSSTTPTSTSAQGSVLTMAPTVENSVAQNFNPFSATSPLSDGALGATSLIYEPLLQFNVVKPQVYPWLATSYAWSNGGRTITFTIRPGVKWSDGKPMTAADVAFTYQLTKQYPAINIEGLDITSVSSTGDTVTLTFPSPQYQELQSIASVYIVPKHIWSQVGNPSLYSDANPVGTGPFVLKSFTPQGITLTKNPSYWQPGLPKVSEIDIPVYTSDTTLQEALSAGQVQWSTDFIPGVQQLYVAKNSHYHFWGAPIYAVALDPNLSTWPTNQLAVRQAISLAIDRTSWFKEAESGQGAPLTNASGLPPTLSQFIAPAVQGMSLTQNTSQARSILKNAGFVMGPNGYFQQGGRTLALTITAPSAFADWVEAGSILVQDLKAAGIDATFVGQSVAGWRANVAAGNFDLTPYWESLSPGVNPYALYNSMLNSSVSAPIGKPASGDFERLNSPKVDGYLAQLASASNAQQMMAALSPIEQYVATQLPVIPAIADAAFDEYNDQSYTGWPSPSNPYEEGAASNITNEVVLLHLTPRS